MAAARQTSNTTANSTNSAGRLHHTQSAPELRTSATEDGMAIAAQLRRRASPVSTATSSGGDDGAATVSESGTLNDRPGTLGVWLQDQPPAPTSDGTADRFTPLSQDSESLRRFRAFTFGSGQAPTVPVTVRSAKGEPQQPLSTSAPGRCSPAKLAVSRLRSGRAPLHPGPRHGVASDYWLEIPEPTIETLLEKLAKLTGRHREARPPCATSETAGETIGEAASETTDGAPTTAMRRATALMVIASSLPPEEGLQCAQTTANKSLKDALAETFDPIREVLRDLVRLKTPPEETALEEIQNDARAYLSSLIGLANTLALEGADADARAAAQVIPAGTSPESGSSAHPSYRSGKTICASKILKQLADTLPINLTVAEACHEDLLAAMGEVTASKDVDQLRLTYVTRLCDLHAHPAAQPNETDFTPTPDAGRASTAERAGRAAALVQGALAGATAELIEHPGKFLTQIRRALASVNTTPEEAGEEINAFCTKLEIRVATAARNGSDNSISSDGE